jgi:hypothetical protein
MADPDPLDLDPNPLVTRVTAGLHQRGVAGLVSRADAGKSAQELSGSADGTVLANALAGKASLPELVTFAGYLGGTLDNPTGEEPATWRLLYLDSKLWTWLLVPDDGIVLRERVEEEGARGKERDVLWVNADAMVRRGSGPQSVHGRFLSGDFTRAGDFAASLSGGTFSAATGIFCEAVTPGSCGPRTRPR